MPPSVSHCPIKDDDASKRAVYYVYLEASAKVNNPGTVSQRGTETKLAEPQKELATNLFHFKLNYLCCSSLCNSVTSGSRFLLLYYRVCFRLYPLVAPWNTC